MKERLFLFKVNTKRRGNYYSIYSISTKSKEVPQRYLNVFSEKLAEIVARGRNIRAGSLCVLEDPDNLKVTWGMSFCSSLDTFNKERGLLIAKGRAKNNVWRDL